MMKLRIFFCFLISISVWSLSTGHEYSTPTVVQPLSTVILSPNLAQSPFYSRQGRISEMLYYLLKRKIDHKAFAVLKLTVQVEKKWRQMLCQQFFDAGVCNFGIRTAPFDMLKIGFVNSLRRDPTDEIISELRSSVGRLLVTN